MNGGKRNPETRGAAAAPAVARQLAGAPENA